MVKNLAICSAQFITPRMLYETIFGTNSQKILLATFLLLECI